MRINNGNYVRKISELVKECHTSNELNAFISLKRHKKWAGISFEILTCKIQKLKNEYYDTRKI